jgi:hypothetical protein
MMKKSTLLAATLLATGAISAQAAEMVLYDNPGMTGRQLTVRGYMPDISSFGFNDRASSISVRSGTWEVCTDAQFRGFCATLQPGDYRALDPRFSDRISSAREVGESMVQVAPPPNDRRASIEMFSGRGYRGRSVTLDHNAWNLNELRFNDRAASVVVREGTWELCSEGGFRGTCRVFEPGNYAELGPGLSREISSARLVGSTPARRDYQATLTPPPAVRPNVELFEGKNFDGSRFGVVRDADNLDARGFNDRANSMIIHEGQWEMCSNAGFNGRCRVFGPGRYADLGRMNSEISSVRRIN